jgi:hypothetical protein
MPAAVALSLSEGLFWRCDDPDFPPGAHRAACGFEPSVTSNATDGSAAPNGHRWVNAALLHYDDIGHALLSTFVVSSGGWEFLLADALASTEVDHQVTSAARERGGRSTVAARWWPSAVA